MVRSKRSNPVADKIAVVASHNYAAPAKTRQFYALIGYKRGHDAKTLLYGDYATRAVAEDDALAYVSSCGLKDASLVGVYPYVN